MTLCPLYFYFLLNDWNKPFMDSLKMNPDESNESNCLLAALKTHTGELEQLVDSSIGEWMNK